MQTKLTVFKEANKGEKKLLQSSWLSFWLLKLCMIYPKDDIALESRNDEKSEDTGKKYI